ncbi:MAG: nucleoside deaminase [Muribaculaceae bacterium]|nr:nucleoside deaminase [Muribaculaceae bacterium]
MWSDLSNEWKMCFKLAWQSFTIGCTPVGAIIKDSENNILAQNGNGASNIFHPKISHAEMNALSNISEIEDIDGLSIYTSLEPCVMCFSAIYVQKIRKLFYATKDPHAGGTFLYKMSPYFSLRKMDIIQLKDDEYSFVNAILLILHELRCRKAEELDIYLSDWEEYPLFVETAKDIFINYGIEKLSESVDAEEAYNFIASYM